MRRGLVLHGLERRRFRCKRWGFANNAEELARAKTRSKKKKGPGADDVLFSFSYDIIIYIQSIVQYLNRLIDRRPSH